MANPRKFSEKIALHNQKQAEETAAFEEIMREVMGATRNRAVSNVASYNTNGNNQQQQQQQQHLHITSPFNATRAGSLPNVNQIGQTPETNQNSKCTGIDLRSALNNLQEIKNDIRSDHTCRRNTINASNRSPHRHHSSHNIASIATNTSYNDVNQLQFTNSASSKRSQSPYSMNNNAYLSPPAADNQWRRTNSDSALHQSTLISTNINTTNQSDGFNQILQTNNSSPQDSCNNSPGQTPAMIIDNNSTEMIYTNSTSDNQMMNWDIARTMNNNSDKFLLSASLPDQQLRPRSCEVPGINIYPSQEENNSSDSSNTHHHIPISSNTGSLPDLTNLHFPVPLNVPIDSDEQNSIKMNANNQNSSYSNGPDSPYSPTSSHNSNLSPPPPCNMINNYNTTPRNQSPNRHRQQSPGPSPSPTASRRRAHHNANTMIMGNHRQQTQQTQITTMGAHRSTTPSDSCSAPTSPASQNISPSNSPELAVNNQPNGVQTATTTNQHFAPLYNSYLNHQQANLLQHQLEQFRMTNDSDPTAAGYVMTCSPNIISQQQQQQQQQPLPNNNQNSNVFYLDSLTLSQFNESVVMSQQFSPNQLTTGQTSSFNNDIFYDSNQSLNWNMQTDLFLKSELPNPMYNSSNNSSNTGNNQQHLSNSSHCTTPQTPSSIPDIILTGPNNLDETLQTSNDLIKDLNNMNSFDSDIFSAPNEDIRTGSFDSFDLDSLQILHDIETNHQ